MEFKHTAVMFDEAIGGLDLKRDGIYVDGTLGGGGLGDLAIRYGYQRFRTDVMIASVVVIIVMVAVIQFVGTKLTNYMLAKR